MKFNLMIFFLLNFIWFSRIAISHQILGSHYWKKFITQNTSFVWIEMVHDKSPPTLISTLLRSKHIRLRYCNRIYKGKKFLVALLTSRSFLFFMAERKVFDLFWQYNCNKSIIKIRKF
jgi:hypothetical protein